MISVVVPFTPGACRHRDTAWKWIRERYELLHPDLEVIEGHGDPTRWSKGSAVANAVEQAAGDLLVVADADTFITAAALTEATDAVANGAPWAVPHLTVYRLSEAHSTELYRRAPVDDPGHLPRKLLDRFPYRGYPGGGIAVLPRATYDQIPIDRRFEGWGGEDDAWGRALDTLAGPHWRGGAPLWHLWHPLQPTHNLAGRPFAGTDRLVGAYKEATGVPRLMAALVAGEAPEPAPADLDRPAVFRSDELRFVTVRDRKLRFVRGEIETTDPETADVLRSTPAVWEVTA